MSAKNDQANMSLVGHLREIRNRIALSVTALVVAFIACFAIIKPLANAMLQMGLDAGFQYVYLSPSELLTSYFQAGAGAGDRGGFCRCWSLKSGALSRRRSPGKEKRAIKPALLGGFFFFCLGALFSYMVALPFMIQFLVNFSTSDFINSAISVASYLDFMIGMLLTFGVVFEEPMLAFVLTKLGILTPNILRKVRRYAIPVIFVIAAIITPPDVVSQFMVAVPMIGLYELSILISSVIYKKKQNEDDADDDEDEEDEYDDDEEDDDE
ncbi:MAG: twin-arginine translocase subunit TatC [Christensenellales bacterium]